MRRKEAKAPVAHYPIAYILAEEKFVAEKEGYILLSLRLSYRDLEQSQKEVEEALSDRWKLVVAGERQVGDGNIIFVILDPEHFEEQFPVLLDDIKAYNLASDAYVEEVREQGKLYKGLYNTRTEFAEKRMEQPQFLDAVMILRKQVQRLYAQRYLSVSECSAIDDAIPYMQITADYMQHRYMQMENPELRTLTFPFLSSHFSAEARIDCLRKEYRELSRNRQRGDESLKDYEEIVDSFLVSLAAPSNANGLWDDWDYSTDEGVEAVPPAIESSPAVEEGSAAEAFLPKGKAYESGQEEIAQRYGIRPKRSRVARPNEGRESGDRVEKVRKPRVRYRNAGICSSAFYIPDQDIETLRRQHQEALARGEEGTSQNWEKKAEQSRNVGLSDTPRSL